MVEQFGLAIMPLCLNALSGFISGTTKGTSGSILKALLLSITTVPDSTACGIYTLLLSRPAEKNAKSTPLKDFDVNCSTGIFSPLYSSFFPIEREEASSLKFLTGNSRASKSFRNSLPTAPVAPAITTFFDLIFLVYD